MHILLKLVISFTSDCKTFENSQQKFYNQTGQLNEQDRRHTDMCQLKCKLFANSSPKVIS